MVKTIILKQIGWETCGTALLNLWGGGKGAIEMTPVFIPVGQLTKGAFIKAINDGRFGCESIAKASVDVYEAYEHGARAYRTTLFVKEPSEATTGV